MYLLEYKTISPRFRCFVMMATAFCTTQHPYAGNQHISHHVIQSVGQNDGPQVSLISALTILWK